MEDKIIIKGARVHNLNNIDLEIPKNKLVVFTGVSGSGKSSLAFDTIFAEGQRRYLESLSPYARQFLGEMERADVDKITGLSPAIAIGQKGLSRNPRSTVGTLTEIYDYLRVLFSRLGEIHCPLCNSRIKKLSLEEMIDIIKDEAKDQEVLILSPVVRGRKGEYYQLFYDFLHLGYSEARIDKKHRSLRNRLVLSRYKKHDIDIVIDRLFVKEESRLFEAVENALNFSKGLVIVSIKDKEFILSSNWTCPNDNFSFPEVEPRLFSFNSPHGACSECNGLGRIGFFFKDECPSCLGKRLRPEALAVRIKGKNINDLVSMSISDLFEFFGNYEKGLNQREKTISVNVIKEINDRLNFLLQVGLDYLSLEREAETLSGGETQRIRLASQVGSHLSNTLYVLDEPTVGLHERDTDRLINTLKALKARNNSIIIVEHDEKVIQASDQLIDLGPMAGKLGGNVVLNAEVKDALTNDKYKSLTLDYLTGRRKIDSGPRRKSIKEKLKLTGARANNLKNINVEIPLRRLVCITGVSGSGKSSLLYDSLYSNLIKIKNRRGKEITDIKSISGTEYIDKINMISQAPIGRSPRSNPATYTGIFTHIRDFYSQLEESRARGYNISRFSFNVSGGRCEACSGAGYNLIEMHFLPSVFVKCEVCKGRRFNRETLEVKHKKKSISDVLDMTVDEALVFFKGFYNITDKLKVLQNVGLGYIQLGQSATTLSGGEAQRIRLSRELTTGLGLRTLYLLDEPTVGLHYHDVELLLKVLNNLVDQGNTVLVIEHNMQIIKSADYIIDIGPEGGERGGKVVAFGSPEDIANNKKSITGKYLKPYLS
jgi:excinuclease ABC subunit A